MDYAIEIKDRLTLQEIARHYGFTPNRQGRIPCPFHNGKDQNLGLKDRYYNCFVCGAKGDAIKFVQELFGLNFQDSISKLNDDFCLGLPIGQRIDRRTQLEMNKAAFDRKRKIEAEKKQKDPILFGTFQNREKKVCIDRFYYLGDWIDEFCDLTLDKMINETDKLGRNIIRTIATPKDVKELREYIDAHYEVEKDSISKIVRRADADLSQKRNIFSKVKTVFSRKK